MHIGRGLKAYPKTGLWLFLTLLLLLSSGPLVAAEGSAELSVLPPDATYVARQNQMLTNLASKFVFRTYGDGDYVKFGFDATYLTAKFELFARGLPGGLDPSTPEAHKYINNFAQHALDYLGTRRNPGPWSWPTIGLPGGMHAALSLGFILHQWGDQLPDDTIELIRRALSDTSWWTDADREFMVNGRVSITAGTLLAGEYFGYDSELWQHGEYYFRTFTENAMLRGTLEINAPTYTTYHYAPLMLLQELADEKIKNQSRALLDYELLMSAHMYLPGGGLGAPQSRDYGGGAKDSSTLATMYSVYFDDPEVPWEGFDSAHAIGAASSYVPYPVLRSIFLDKGEGYTFWGYTDAPVGGSRLGNGFYALGPDRKYVSPWQGVMMPGGEAMMGFAYGTRYQSIHVSMGVYVKDVKGNFQILYQYQPWVEGDKTMVGGGLPSTNGDADPEDFVREGYDRERMLYGRTLIQIWDPDKTYKDTRVHLPNWDKFGGKMVEADGWYVGQLGRNYIAFRPLGDLELKETRDADTWTYLRLAGRSGSIIELANTDQFATIDDYVADLKTRYLKFDKGTPYYAEFDALDPDTGKKARIRLEYQPERRFIDGKAITMEDLDQGLVHSPFVSWDPETYTMTVSRPGYETVNYDWDDGVITLGSLNGPRATFNSPAYGQVLRSSVPLDVTLEKIEPAHVEFKIDGKTIYSGEALPAPNEVSIDPVTLKEGVHFIELNVEGKGDVKLHRTVGFSVAPKLHIASPASSEVLFRGSIPVELSLENISVGEVTIKVDDNEVYRSNEEPTGFAIDSLQLEEGRHTLTATVTDVYGNSMEKTSSFSVDNWRQFTDNLDTPLASGFFGTIDRSMTSSKSSGWDYADEASVVFDDQGRRVRTTDKEEYLVWETPLLGRFTGEIYAKDDAIAGSVAFAISADQADWQELPVTVTLAESQTDGWHRFHIEGVVPAGATANWLRLTFSNYAPAEELQLGEVTCVTKATD